MRHKTLGPSSVHAQIGMEGAEKKTSDPSREVELLEAAMAAAAAALFVSGLKKILPFVLSQWPASLLMAPSPLLLLLLNLVITFIVVASFRPEDAAGNGTGAGGKSKKSMNRGCKGALTSEASSVADERKQSGLCGRSRAAAAAEESSRVEEGWDDEELNARVEAFIAAFRQQLRVDSSSGAHRTNVSRPRTTSTC